ncbi:hypothetical protein CAC42_6475 [Sphaceloma murrayae]|uniref:Uncharacterized protein n=1 Tax=Sphaceloma murrayae TaxID=2082308 RepID=A0A2K1QGF0_9PEZI|nr:hypothetical protein CAC42_6475 [Sphaceloma murrayae]
MAPPHSTDGFSPLSRVAHDTSIPQSSPFSTMPNFDILDWHPAYQSCQRYFLDRAQYEAATQALCALINIRLPHQWRSNPITSSTATSHHPANQPNTDIKDWPRSTTSRSAAHDASPPSSSSSSSSSPLAFVSLIPYIRRLIVTGFDTDGVLHGFFGDAWQIGITPLRECERRNYLFSAKHGGWGTCKGQYDLSPEETVPFVQPLRDATTEELHAADRAWSEWLLMEDWMVGVRAPRDDRGYGRSGRYGGGEFDRER